MIDTFTEGICICLVFVPLLALTADQMRAIKNAIQKEPAFEAHHINYNTLSAPLSEREKHNNIVDGYRDLINVTNMFCLPGLVCIHARLEWFMGSIAQGNIDVPLPDGLIDPCNTQCYVCNNKYKKYFLLLIYEGVCKFLRSRRLRDALYNPLTVKDCGYDDWLFDIFGKTTVNKYNGTAFCSLLIALNFTEFETKGGKEVVVISNAATNK